MNPVHSSTFGRVLAVAVLCVAFLIMASIFVPHQIEARDGDRGVSTDPHEGLRLIGVLEHAGHIVRVYATDFGPRYSVYEMVGGSPRELGVLLSEQQMERHHPDLPIKDAQFHGRQIMLAPAGDF